MAESPVCQVQSEINLVDRISQLPNEVLVDMLSLLTLKEVGRSSVLSKRWRELWKMTAYLNFDAPEVSSEIACTVDPEIRRRKIDLERSKFLTWVNQVVRMNECTYIEEFRVKFDLDASCAHDIEEWIKFMIQKRAKRVELALSGLRVGDFYSISKECCDYIKSESNLTSLMNLTSLCLDYVNVDGEQLEYLLSKCRNLEMLSVRSSKTLVDLKVIGPSLALKYLMIRSCEKLRRLGLRAPKLERFIYFGGEVKFFMGMNPRLTEFEMGADYREKADYTLVHFKRLLPQLETLTLRVSVVDEALRVELPKFGEFSNLKHLKIEMDMKAETMIRDLAQLIHAAPVLAKFTLMLSPWYHPNDAGYLEPEIRRHVCLKEVEIIGFRGGTAGFDTAKFMVRSAINLEKMVINPMHPKDWKETWSNELRKRLAQIDKYVKVLKEGLPPSAELTVIGM